MPTKIKISSSVQKLEALLIFIAGGGLLQLLFASLATRGFVGLLRDRDSNMLGLDSEPPKTSSNHDAASFLSSDASNTQEFNVTASKEKVSTQKTSTNEIRRDFNIGRDWNGYRIGDGIKFTREQPLPLLELPKTDQVIVHLRLGDGLCGDERWDNKLVCGEQRPTNAGRFRNCWKHDYDCFFYHGNRYAYSQRWYDTIASDLTSAASEISSNVSIVSDARHWTRAQDRRKGNYSVDKKCRQEIASFLRGLGFTSIEFRNSEETHNSPDQDFAYLCSAKVFVPSGGGYSRLAAQVVERRGGMVIKPKDPDKELPMVQLSGKNHTDVIQVVSEMVDLSISGKNISAPFYAANSSAYFLAVDQEIGPVSRIWNDTEDGQDTLRIPLSAIGCEAVRNETVVAAIGGQQRQPDGSMWQMGAGRSANNLGRATSWQIAAGRSANNLGQGYTLGHSLVLKLKNTTFNPWLEQTKYVGCAFRSPDEVVINAYRWHDPNAGMFIGKLALNFTVKVPRGKDHG